LEGDPILEADSVGKRFADRKILSSASVAVHAGEMTGLLGRMGEGKSTLLKICVGLVGSDSGWVKYKGKLRPSPRLSTLASEGVYYLPEYGSLASSLSLQEHFDLFRRRFSLESPAQIVDRFDLGGFLKASPDKLSTGERRRAELAILSYRRPECLLADEPFRGLGPISADAIGRGLQDLASTGCAILLTGHEVRTIIPFLTSIVWLTSGTTYSLGRPAVAWQNEYFRREYLGPAE
jgi:ABC-type multidrug transport system ATPase subunit